MLRILTRKKLAKFELIKTVEETTFLRSTTQPLKNSLAIVRKLTPYINNTTASQRKGTRNK